MDNEQPRQPPKPQSGHPMAMVTPEVPELTIFSPTNRPNTNQKMNFIQRISKSDEKKNHPQMRSQPKHQNIMNSAKPSVPDLSLFDPQPNHRPTQNNKENIFDNIPKPSVPDLTILDEDPKQQSNSSSRVFEISYKNMLLNSHEQFMKQLRSEDPEKPMEKVTNGKKSALFNNQKYQENPLRKYAPKAAQQIETVNLDSSSILIESEMYKTPAEAPVDEDEITFKKVAAMLNQIQQLAIPSNKDDDPSNKRTTNILKQLAMRHLTKEEQEFYDIESEFKELERNDEDDEVSNNN